MTMITSSLQHKPSKEPNYDPAAYWERRGKGYTCHPRADEALTMLEWLQELQPQSILEVGAGNGWVYDQLATIDLADRLTMCDFVHSLRQECYQRIGILPESWDSRTLPYAAASFDMVLTSHVLLHVPPGDIENFFAEQVRVASQWVYAATLFSHEGKLASHCFIHDYVGLFEQFDLVVEKERRFPSPRRARSKTTVHVQWLLRKG